MNVWQELVNKFRFAMDLPVPEQPRQLTTEEAERHIKMIRDEFEKEFVPAIRDNDLVAFYDAGIDVIVYVIGAMSNAGMDLDPGFKEIMRSNMTKMDPTTGKAIRAMKDDPSGEPEGKILKGPFYSPPSLGVILNEMTRFGPEDNRVYKDLKVPLTLGIGGPKIGEGVINMDHNGGMYFTGEMTDVSILPVIDHLGFRVSGVSIGEDEPEEVGSAESHTAAHAQPELDLNFNDFAYLDSEGNERSTADDREQLRQKVGEWDRINPAIWEDPEQYLKPVSVKKPEHPDDIIDHGMSR